MVNEFPQVRNNYTGTSDSAQALLYHQPSVRLKLNDSRQSVNETNRQFTLHFRKVVLTLASNLHKGFSFETQRYYYGFIIWFVTACFFNTKPE